MYYQHLNEDKSSSSRILIADDDEDLLELLKTILENNGYLVDTALNASEAYKLFKKRHHQVVVLDINMPGITGIELAEQIRKFNEDVQIIIMTAFTDVDFAVQAIKYQVFEYLIKPFKFEELISNIDKALEKWGLIHQNKEIIQKYHYLVQNFPDGILELNTEGDILFYNASAMEIAAYNQGILRNSNFVNLNPEFAYVFKKIKKSTNKKRLHDEIVEIRQSNGTTKTVQILFNALNNFNDGDTSYLTILRDITKRKKYEEEILAAKNRFQSIFNAFTDPIVLIDKSYKVVAANHFAHQLIGVSFQKLMNLRCNELFCKSSKICRECPVKHTFETSETSFKPISTQTPQSNEMVHYELYTYPLKGVKNNIYEVILYAKDVTQSKELQRQIAQSEKMASIGKLAAGIAHELKNPLAVISASAQFCLERLNLEGSIKEHLEVIYRNTQNSNKILMDLLSFAKPTEIMFESVNINWLINSSLKLLFGEFNNAKVQVRKNLSTEMPDIQGDAKSLIQVFINILINAVQATGEKGRIYVKTSYDLRSHKVVVVIKDNGSGIPEEHLEKIFDPFFTTKLKGTGLGLSICQRIIVEHQGTIRVKSKKDKGTKFIIEFPVKLLLKK